MNNYFQELMMKPQEEVIRMFFDREAILDKAKRIEFAEGSLLRGANDNWLVEYKDGAMPKTFFVTIEAAHSALVTGNIADNDWAEKKFPVKEGEDNWIETGVEISLDDLKKVYGENQPNDVKITDLRGISPLRAISGFYISTNNLLETLTVKLETNKDGSLYIFKFEGEENYIVTVFSGEDSIERRLVPVLTEPRMVEMLMTEMLARAKDNFRHAYKAIVENLSGIENNSSPNNLI